MNVQFGSWLAGARARRFWFEVAAAVLLIVVAAWAVKVFASRRIDARSQREAALTELTEVTERWRAGYVPPTPAESAAWRLSERRVRERGVQSTDRVALAQLVAQRAEELGIPDVTVGFTDTEDLTPPPERVVDVWSFGMAPYAVTVEFTADYAAAVSFVGSLPPQVQVRRLVLESVPEGVRASTLLIVTRASGGSNAVD